MEKFYKKRIILMSIRNKIFFATKNMGVPNINPRILGTDAVKFT